MLFSHLLPLLTIAAAAPSNWGSNANDIPCHQQEISAQWRDQIAANYLEIWNTRNYDLLNVTMSPDVLLLQDRIHAGGNGSIDFTVTNSSGFQNFVEASHEGFSKYEFVDLKHFGEDNLVVISWMLDAVYQDAYPAATIQPNTSVSYNGSDMLTLDRCTGVIAEINSHQDFINFFHQLGLPLGTV